MFAGSTFSAPGLVRPLEVVIRDVRLKLDATRQVHRAGLDSPPEAFFASRKYGRKLLAHEGLTSGPGPVFVTSRSPLPNSLASIGSALSSSLNSFAVSSSLLRVSSISCFRRAALSCRRPAWSLSASLEGIHHLLVDIVLADTVPGRHEEVFSHRRLHPGTVDRHKEVVLKIVKLQLARDEVGGQGCRAPGRSQ